MLLSEIKKDAQISIVAEMGDREVELVTTVAEPMNGAVLAHMIYQGGKRVSFHMEGLSLRMRVVHSEENKVYEFRGVTISNVKTNDNQVYYKILCPLPSTAINRRNAVRIWLGVDGEVVANGKIIGAIVKDISLTGIAFIVDVPLELKTPVLVNFEDMKQNFALGAVIVRKEVLEDGRILYGCRLGKESGNIAKYLNDKQRLKLRRQHRR